MKVQSVIRHPNKKTLPIYLKEEDNDDGGVMWL